jgi:hypothetical protein
VFLILSILAKQSLYNSSRGNLAQNGAE